MLILGTCKYITLHGKGNFADKIQLKDLGMERVSHISQVKTV